jgi:O-antigen/teichoic acid export membrane protein
MADQAIISGTNFATSIVAARVLGPATFGVFAFLLTILYMMEAAQRSLVTTPHNVIGPSKDGNAYLVYTSSTFFGQIVVATGLAILIAIAGIVTLQFSAESGLMVLALSLVAFTWQIQEFTRRVLYTELRIPAALVSDSASYLGRLVLVGGLLMMGMLTAPVLFLAFAIPWALGALIGLWNIRRSLTWVFDRTVIREHWEFGRWLFASNAFSYLPRYILAGLLSSTLTD